MNGGKSERDDGIMIDILIIGSGPAGLTAAIYAARARFSHVVAEKDFMGSGAVAVTEQVDNFPGLYGISGYDLGEKFREHAEKLGTEIITAEAAEITQTESGFKTRFKDGSETDSKTIVYAAGTSYRRLDIEGDKLLGVSYCATCDGAFYDGKTAAVIGGGDTALTDALYLAKIARKVYLIHRRDEFRANRSLVEKVKNCANIELVLSAKPTKIIGDKNVNAIEISQNGETKTLNVNGVFVAIGSVPNTDVLKGFVELDERGYVKADENGETSLPGFYAAGDVRTKALRQVITACSDGACCVNSVEEYLNLR